MDQGMIRKLDSFFADRTIDDIDRHSFIVCNLRDMQNMITISLVFLRDWDSLATDDFNVVSLENRGAVFTFPGYWISIPKELAMPYVEGIIDDYYLHEVSKWNGGGNGSNTGNNGNGNCNCNCPVPTPVPVPNPNCKFI